MKLEVGMYVRTDLGEIGKVTSVSSNLNDLGINGIAYNSEPFLRGNEIKSSNNIIDLIEVGDYVNGYEVTSKDQFLGFGNHDWYMINDEIKSIVTKEQFESMSYRIGSEE